jgi:hypothetical protein
VSVNHRRFVTVSVNHRRFVEKSGAVPSQAKVIGFIATSGTRKEH